MTSSARWRHKYNWIGPTLLSLAAVLLIPSTDAIGDIGGSTKDQGEIQIDPRTQPRWRVGLIFIVGNEEIPDSIILEQCPLCPCQPASIANLREAEENLASLGLFVVDPKRGIRPIVKFDDRKFDNQIFHDVWIEVKEKPNAKRILAIRESIRFVVDSKVWGFCAALYKAEGFPKEILNHLKEGNWREVPELVRDKFTKEEGKHYYPPLAIDP